MPGAEEVSLAGGRITAGVVRVGRTVRRPGGPASPFVAALLTHLEAVGFGAAPRFLGTDGAGRDVLSFIPGETRERWRRWSDAQITAAGRLLRALHDATASSALTAGAEVVCHGDPGPNNVVFRASLPVAFLDFDLAAPGERLDDVAYMGWAWCLSSGRAPVAGQARQLRLLCDAYGLAAEARGRMVDRIAERQAGNAAWWRERKRDASTRPDARARADEVVAWSERERTFVLEHRGVLAAALS